MPLSLESAISVASTSIYFKAIFSASLSQSLACVLIGREKCKKYFAVLRFCTCGPWQFRVCSLMVLHHRVYVIFFGTLGAVVSWYCIWRICVISVNIILTESVSIYVNTITANMKPQTLKCKKTNLRPLKCQTMKPWILNSPPPKKKKNHKPHPVVENRQTSRSFFCIFPFFSTHLCHFPILCIPRGVCI